MWNAFNLVQTPFYSQRKSREQNKPKIPSSSTAQRKRYSSQTSIDHHPNKSFINGFHTAPHDHSPKGYLTIFA